MKFDLTYFLQKLLDSLPQNTYAAKWNEDTDIYRIFSMYASEFASGSAQLEVLENDLDIDFCQNLKIYDNFGVYTGVGKYMLQTYNTDEYDSASGSRICYRKQTKYLIVSSLKGGTTDAVNYAGRAFTGITPTTEDGYNHPRWKLTYASGSGGVRGFDASKSYYYLEDTSVSWPDYKFRGALCRFPTASKVFYLEVIDSDENKVYFETMDNEIGPFGTIAYSASFSFLEHNTKIYKEKDRLKGSTLRMWIPPCYDNTERKGHIKSFVQKVVPAATSLIFDWVSHYAAQTTYVQFSSGSYDTNYFRVNSDGSVVNIARTTF